MIQIEALTKVFRGGRRPVAALEDVTLRLEPGVWGIVGPNGAGKTTLLGLVLGFLRPTAGAVLVDGSPPRRYVRRHGAAYLPERFRLPGAWPVRASLRAFARLEGLDPAAARRAADDGIERLGLEEHADRPFGLLSRGLSQRVGLAQVLLADRRLVVLDEPTTGLDPLWRVRFRDLVAGIGRDRTVLLASHEIPEIERIAERVVLLRDGRVADSFDARPDTDGPLRYRLRASAEPGDLEAAFPGATPDPDGEDGPEAPVTIVTVADARELSHRLAALLAAGATIHEVRPLSPDLESRVRQRLEDG